MTALDAELDGTLIAPLTGRNPLPAMAAIVTDREGTLYEKATGVLAVGESAPMSLDTVLTVLSTTKPLVSTAALQLVESGDLDLDAPASRYVPELGEVKVITGFDESGGPVLRDPVREITTRMLLLHTAGFGYDNFNETYMQLVQSGALANAGEATMAALRAPLLFDPGERWEYGLNLDWVGVLVQRIAGARLADVISERILTPLRMHDTAFVLTPSMWQRLAPVHTRTEDGAAAPIEFVLPQDTEIDMGGHGLYSTAHDYVKFIRAWLNDGEGADGRILKPETVDMASRNGLGDLKVRDLPAVNTFMTTPVDFFYPETSKSWALSFMVTDERTSTGRSPGTLSWAGLASTYFWIDRTAGIGGFWAGNLLPFGDKAAFDAYLAFETAAYRRFGTPATRRLERAGVQA